jgi:hypothetical protein
MTAANRPDLLSEKLLALLRLIDYWPGWIDYFREHFEHMEEDDPRYGSDEERREAEEASRFIETATQRLINAKREPTLSIFDELTRVLRNIVSDADVERVFTVEALGAVPGIFYRWKQLADLRVGSMPEERVTRCLRQATTCYLWGLPDASAVLCRAGLESALLEVLASRLGGTILQDLNLEALIKLAHRNRLLDDHMAGKAHRIRKVGNDAVHMSTCSEQVARRQILDTAEVLQRIYGGSGRP